MGEHAVLSASSSHRWMNCPPSVRLTEGIPDHGSPFAAEGSEAHALCEYRLKRLLGQPCEDPLAVPGVMQYYDETMEDAATGYAAYVMEIIEETKRTCPDPLVMVEQRLDFSRWVPDGFGTGDAVIVADGCLHVIDFKYGTGVEVSAKHNSQMRLYALGALEMFGELYDIDTITMTIYQPRLSNLSTDTISKADLMEWAEYVMAPLAAMAYAGDGEQNAGEWCRFCKLRTTCRKRAEANMLLAQHDFALPPTLTDADVAVILGRLPALIAWAEDIKAYALNAALEGRHFDGWKLVEGRSNRSYTDEAKVAEVVREAGVDPYEHKLLGITAMEKALGRKRFKELLDPYIDRPPGKPTLAPESDKRTALNDPTTDFKEG